MIDETAVVFTNELVGPNLYVMTLSAPQIAAAVKPGQFVHMNIPDAPDHILRRPFSVYTKDSERGMLELLYQKVGAGTERMAEWKKGLSCQMIGPIGQPWKVLEGDHRVLLVGGGVGAAPLYMFAQELIERGISIDVILGAQTERALVCHDRYVNLCQAHPRCSTDDGSFGREGFCTSLVEEALEQSSRDADQYGMVAVCGPEPLMRKVVALTQRFAIPCFVSLERRMACGIGACLSCVVETQDGMKRACVDGPVFDAKEIIW